MELRKIGRDVASGGKSPAAEGIGSTDAGASDPVAKEKAGLKPATAQEREGRASGRAGINSARSLQNCKMEERLEVNVGIDGEYGGWATLFIRRGGAAPSEVWFFKECGF
jgi:hypothetical protein